MHNIQRWYALKNIEIAFEKWVNENEQKIYKPMKNNFFKS